MNSLQEQGLLDEADKQNLLLNFSFDQNHFLTPELWMESEIGKLYGYLWLGKIENTYAAVIPLRGINNLSGMADLGQNTVFVDKVATVNALINSYRKNAGFLLVSAFAAVFLLLSLRYGIRYSALIVSSPLVALSASVTGLLLLGEDLSLFNTLALFLVLGIGVDFGIFFMEANDDNSHTLLAIMLSALTTIFSFGMLTLSNTPVIHAFGLTMLIGISTTLILSTIASHFRLRRT
jgi:predicted exporter